MESTITYFEVTSALIQPLVSAINSGLSLMVPVGIGVMGSFVGISIVKRVVYSFL